MKTKPAYLVVRKNDRGAIVIDRVRTTWPSLEAGEALVSVSLDLPDDFLSNPVHTLEIPADAITVGVVAEAVEA